ncbi:anthrone oxygenase family protein [Micromonospora rhizosphaerae]|uniref:anthrone oxygenase family protein n=1 Tax=Micromonospora rhizosphaerae TaxID=568872 RepID=UPI001C402EC9|nr:anthrone oxygenase family protein [Micromonospora rhizosphaerae]
MQTTMALAMVSCTLLAVLSRGVARRLTAIAGGLVLTSFLVTRLGNVPINAQIKGLDPTGRLAASVHRRGAGRGQVA